MDHSKSPATFFFLQLGIIATLYASVVSFVSFGFAVINYMFPDRLAGAFDPYSTTMRFAISTLIIVFPVLVYLSKLMYQMLKGGGVDRDMPVRKWLSYLTLFLAGVAIVIDLVTLMDTFLGGEITTRFIAKVFLVLAVAFAVFWYTLRDLKGVYFAKPHLLRIFTSIVSGIVVLSLVGGIYIMGSPASQRDLRDDMTRVSHLQSIQWDVVNHYQRVGKVPASLEELVDPLYPDIRERFLDPATEMMYEYRPIASTTPAFELCATFALDSRADQYEGRGEYGGGMSRPVMIDYGYYPADQSFEHTAGRNCFTRSIDPVRYPINETPGKPMPL